MKAIIKQPWPFLRSVIKRILYNFKTVSETVRLFCCWVCRLIIGYVFHADGSMCPVSECDLHLDSVGEDGSDPVDCKLNFIAGFTYYYHVIILAV